MSRTKPLEICTATLEVSISLKSTHDLLEMMTLWFRCTVLLKLSIFQLLMTLILICLDRRLLRMRHLSKKKELSQKTNQNLEFRTCPSLKELMLRS